MGKIIEFMGNLQKDWYTGGRQVEKNLLDHLVGQFIQRGLCHENRRSLRWMNEIMLWENRLPMFGNSSLTTNLRLQR